MMNSQTMKQNDRQAVHESMAQSLAMMAMVVAAPLMVLALFLMTTLH